MTARILVTNPHGSFLKLRTSVILPLLPTAITPLKILSPSSDGPAVGDYLHCLTGGLHVPNLWIRAQTWALLWTMNCEQKCVSLLGRSLKSQKSLHHALCSLYHLTSTVSNRGCSVNPGRRVKTAGRGWTEAQMTSELLLSQATETLGVFLNTAQPHLSPLLYVQTCQIT